MPNTMTPKDLDDLRQAGQQLEGKSFAMTVAQKIGMPIETLLRFLPNTAQGSIEKAVNVALERCLKVALFVPTHGQGGTSSRRAHTVTTAVTGAVGGFFGLPGLVVELPLTTTVILHSIAGIAQSQGEDLSTPESALACLEVFALGPEGRRTEAMESAYYATRAALAQATRDAASYVAQKGFTKEGAPVLVAFLSRIAARFGLQVSEKAAAQLIPVAGSAGGLALNVMFTNHFQRLAQGHFTIRRLERAYGPEEVRHQYEQLRQKH